MTEEIDIQEFMRLHEDPVYRLNNLYHVKDAASGRAVKFVPRLEQKILIDAIYLRKVRNVLVPKARQLGISTVIDLIILDNLLFRGGVQAAIIDLTQADATKKLRNKIVFGFENLPKILKDQYEILKSNDHVFALRLKGCEEDNDMSEVQAGMGARGDTFQVMHISEWGKIAWADPIRSKEILTGAMPAAKKGLRLLETTWKGAKQGDLWEIMRQAMETKPEDMTDEDFHLFFFPWWNDADYSLEGNVKQINEEVTKYLDETEVEISKREAREFRFTPGQRLWYFKVAWQKGLFRYEEYPSLLEECFKAPIEGAIYADVLDRLRASGAIRPSAIERNFLVHTSWDLGSPINTVTWYFQLVGEEIRVIDLDCEMDLTPAERVARIMGKGYLLGWHFLPHDALGTMKSGRTFQMELHALGLKNTRVVPQAVDVWIGINHLRGMLPRFTFRVPACDKGLDYLAAYHTRRETSAGNALDIPVHDTSSHFADGLRTLAEADEAHMLTATGQPGRVQVLRGIRGYENDRPGRWDSDDILTRFFGPDPNRPKFTKVIR
jgi:hypothetical protein